MLMLNLFPQENQGEIKKMAETMIKAFLVCRGEVIAEKV